MWTMDAHGEELDRSEGEITGTGCVVHSLG
jgi:hypothetical protein